MRFVLAGLTIAIGGGFALWLFVQNPLVALVLFALGWYFLR